MISFLRGEVAQVLPDRVVVEVGGVGFEVLVSVRDAADMPPAGEDVKLYTYMSVSEDAIRLYGFLSQDDLNVYKTLITVSGVGPKAALGILGVLSANDVRFAVFSEDDKALAKAPGIGGKTAKKLILELKDKLKLEDAIQGADAGFQSAEVSSSAAIDAELADTVQALTALGYSNSEALRAVRKVKVTEEMSTQDILKQALKQIGL
jgi:Holliday junction DNA helicase RuvA